MKTGDFISIEVDNTLIEGTVSSIDDNSISVETEDGLVEILKSDLP